MIRLSTGLAVVAVALVLAAIGSVLAGELVVAGVCFLALSFTIYVRETRG